MQKLAERMKGQWPKVLPAFGLDRRYLKNEHGECPLCGGKDRYRFDDKGDGRYFCNGAGCGPGNGFDLAMKFTGLSFKEVAARIEPLIGTGPAAPVTPASPSLPDHQRLKRMWTKESTAIRPDDAAGLWLAKRAGISAPQTCLRFVPRLFHLESKTHHPGMIARVTSAAGKSVHIHRTWLTPAGEKAPVSSPRKLMPGSLEEKGAAIRLFPNVERVLGVGEGIETSLCAAGIFQIPVWSVLNAGGFKGWRPPAGVEEVVIFADADENFVGQLEANVLAAELMALRGKPFRVRVETPPTLGQDWADVWASQCPA
ncbi:toprim domain-containing protein [Methylobacterium sp. SD274]|uniref:DUF7146 domain-containing protein n=1 Tax=Methylobacterium sp. SD274 TaxID=2782009 RepID=UPI001A97276A|nr:toprim domain-containing protein [Methylobacterium sp. SD274]MBO1022596.1 toprim domain-containing protein [Methylobacterium sp. SD274]